MRRVLISFLKCHVPRWEAMFSDCAAGGFRLDVKNKCLHRKGGCVLEQAAQRSAGVAILEVFKRCADAVLRDVILWWTCARWVAELNDSECLFQPS